MRRLPLSHDLIQPELMGYLVKLAQDSQRQLVVAPTISDDDNDDDNKSFVTATS